MSKRDVRTYMFEQNLYKDEEEQIKERARERD